MFIDKYKKDLICLNTNLKRAYRSQINLNNN